MQIGCKQQRYEHLYALRMLPKNLGVENKVKVIV